MDDSAVVAAPEQTGANHLLGLVADGVGRRRSIFDRLDALEAGVRRGLRRLCVVLLLLPLAALVMRRVPDLIVHPFVVWYGMLVLVVTLALFFMALTRYEDPSDPRFAHLPAVDDTPPLPMVPRVSMLLAVMNEIEIINRCVASIVTSDYPNLEVVIVDDASTDGTAARLRELAATHDFTLIELSENVGKKRALVQAAQACTGDVIAFTDSDCVLAPNAIRRCVAAMVMNPRLGAVSGHARALNANATVLTKVQDSWYDGSFRVVKGAEATVGSVSCVSGPLAVFRRDAIWNYFPAWANDRFLGAEFRFATDRQLTGYVLGQLWVGRRLKERFTGTSFVDTVDYPERRWDVGYVRSAEVWTVVPETYRAFLRQQIRWKKSFIRNLCFTGTFMWRRGFAATGLYYGHALWVLAAPFMAVGHLIVAPALGLWALAGLYLAGSLLKGCLWAGVYALENPGSDKWKYRPLMSVVSSVVLSWLLPYSAATLRRSVWVRGVS